MKKVQKVMDPKKNKESLCAAVNLMKLLAHPIRLSILCNLVHQGEMSVGEIVAKEEGQASQSQISQFLAKMRSEGIVTTRKDAQTVYYSIQSRQVKQVVQSLYDIYCGK